MMFYIYLRYPSTDVMSKMGYGLHSFKTAVEDVVYAANLETFSRAPTRAAAEEKKELLQNVLSQAGFPVTAELMASSAETENMVLEYDIF